MDKRTLDIEQRIVELKGYPFFKDFLGEKLPINHQFLSSLHAFQEEIIIRKLLTPSQILLIISLSSSLVTLPPTKRLEEVTAIMKEVPHPTPKITKAKVVIIGGGLAGLSAAFELSHYVHHESETAGIVLIEGGAISGKDHPRYSRGSNPIEVPRYSRMLVSTFSLKAAKSLMMRRKGLATFLEFTRRGIRLQEEIAKKISPHKELIRVCGTIVPFRKKSIDYHFYKMLIKGIAGANYIKELSQVEIEQRWGKSAFSAGLLFKDHGVVDAEGYMASLHASISSKVICLENALATTIQETPSDVKVYVTGNAPHLLGITEIISADKVIIATNAFYQDENLKGKLCPIWELEVSVLSPSKANAENGIDADDNLYWSFQDGYLRIGGSEEPMMGANFRYPGYEQDKIKTLLKQAKELFPGIQLPHRASIYGLQAYTPDEIPIIGQFDNKSRRFYLVGCNGIGNGRYVQGASLLSGIMGYRTLDTLEKKMADIVSPQRKSLRK